MIVTLDANTQNYADASDQTFDIAVADHPNRLMLAAIHRGGITNIDNIHFNGLELTYLDGQGVTDNDTRWYYLYGPPVGTYSFHLHTAGMTACVCNVRVYYNAKQENCFGAVVKASGTSTTPSVNVTSTNGRVVDSMTHLSGTHTASKTLEYSRTVNRWNAGQGTQAAGALSMSWINSVSEAWYEMAVEIYPAVVSAQILIIG